MKYDKITDELEKLGYLCQYHVLINALTAGIPDEKTGFKPDTFFRIELNNNKSVFIYFDRQIPVEIEFTNIDDLIALVKQKFLF